MTIPPNAATIGGRASYNQAQESMRMPAAFEELPVIAKANS